MLNNIGWGSPTISNLDRKLQVAFYNNIDDHPRTFGIKDGLCIVTGSRSSQFSCAGFVAK